MNKECGPPLLRLHMRLSGGYCKLRKLNTAREHRASVCSLKKSLDIHAASLCSEWATFDCGKGSRIQRVPLRHENEEADHPGALAAFFALSGCAQGG